MDLRDLRESAVGGGSVAETFPPKVAAQMLKPKRRGPGKRPRKAVTTLRLPPETLDRWKASGPGWQTRMAAALSRLAPRAAA